MSVALSRNRYFSYMTPACPVAKRRHREVVRLAHDRCPLGILRAKPNGVLRDAVVRRAGAKHIREALVVRPSAQRCTTTFCRM